MVSQRTRLTAEQTNALGHDGYLVVPAVLQPAAVATMRARLACVVRQTVPVLLSGPPPDGVEAGVVHADLDAGEPDFAICHQHPIVAEAAGVVLGGRWRLRELSLRAPLTGFGDQGLHPNEARLAAPAGSLILFNGADLWHSGTLNYSREPRLAVTASLVSCQ